MNKTEIAFQRMGIDSVNLMLTHNLIMDTINGVEPTRTDIITNVSRLGVLSQIQSNTTKGITGDKKQVKAFLNETALQDATIFLAYTAALPTEALMTETEAQVKRLGSKSDSSVLLGAGWLCSKIADHLPQLAALGLNAASQLVFKNALDAFNDIVSAPRLLRKDKKDATAEITTVIAKLTLLFAKMDKLMGGLLKTNPAVVAEYRQLRKVVKPAVQHISGKITVYREGSKTPEANVTVTTSFGTFKTGKKGISLLKSVNEGEQTMTADKPGFISKTVKPVFVNGELTKVVIYLAAA